MALLISLCAGVVAELVWPPALRLAEIKRGLRGGHLKLPHDVLAVEVSEYLDALALLLRPMGTCPPSSSGIHSSP
jgi:hypothetical protein